MSPEGAERRRSLFDAVVLIFAGVLVWQIADVLLILFGAVLLAILLDGLARLLQRLLPIGRRFCLALGIIALGGLLVGAVILVGPQISEQISVLGQKLPKALDNLEKTLEQHAWGDWLMRSLPDSSQMLDSPSKVLGRISGAFSSAFGLLMNSLIILFVGIYLAIDPGLYVRGILVLIPPRGRARAEEVLSALGAALGWWLVGRLASMAIVGALTGIGLWLIGMSLPLALGLIAGLLSFVPMLGPILAAIPGILIALAHDPMMAVYAGAVYWVAQILEGNLITPAIQKRTVAIAPGVLIIAQLLIGVLLGLWAVILATPLVVMVIVLIQMLYVRELLRTQVHVLGNHGHDGGLPDEPAEHDESAEHGESEGEEAG